MDLNNENLSDKNEARGQHCMTQSANNRQKLAKVSMVKPKVG